MGDIDCDAIPADQAVCRTRAALRGNHWLPMTAAPVDADDCAPGLETARSPSGLAVVVVLTGRGFAYELQNGGDCVCPLGWWREIPIVAKLYANAGFADHASALWRWYDMDRDQWPGDDIAREAFDAMGGEGA